MGIQDKFIRPISYYLLDNNPCKDIKAIGSAQLIVDGKKIRVLKDAKQKEEASHTESLTYFV